MPYTGASDTSLPSKVKKMSAKKRRQWVGIFNSAFKRCMAGKTRIKPANKKKCESFAFQNAYGVVKKEDNMSNSRKKRKQKALEVAENPTEDKELEEITDEEAQVLLESYAKGDEKWGEVEVVVVEQEMPYGGAQSWADLEEYRDAEAQTDAVQRTEYEFRKLVSNILEDETLELSAKGDKIATLAEGFSGHAEELTEEYKEEESEPDTSIIDKVLAVIGIKKGIKKAPKTKVKYSGFIVEKDLQGNHRWFGWVSNKFRDRDRKAHPKGEIIAEAAHKEFVEWVYEDTKTRMPQLWLWHTPKTAMKERADWLDYSDGFLLASGPLTEKEAEMWNQLSEKHEMGMSHGFFKSPQYYDVENGIINKYRSFEGSGLPLAVAANEWTDLKTLLQEAKEMGFTPDRRAFLVDALGEEKVAELEASTKDLAEQLKELGIEFKEVEEKQVVEKEDKTLEKPVESETTVLDVKALMESLGLDKLSEYLEGQEAVIKALGKTVEEQNTVIAELKKSDDEKVAEVLKPKVDVKADVMPVWLRKASQSDETILTEEEEKSLELAKETGASWVGAAMGMTADPGANVPM